MPTITTIKQDLVTVINANTGDIPALETGTDEIVAHVFDNCDIDDLTIIQAQIAETCRRKRDEG